MAGAWGRGWQARLKGVGPTLLRCESTYVMFLISVRSQADKAQAKILREETTWAFAIHPPPFLKIQTKKLSKEYAYTFVLYTTLKSVSHSVEVLCCVSALGDERGSPRYANLLQPWSKKTLVVGRHTSNLELIFQLSTIVACQQATRLVITRLKSAIILGKQLDLHK